VTSYEEAPASHEEVMQAGMESEDVLKNFVSRIVLHIAQILYPAQNDDDDDDDDDDVAAVAVGVAAVAIAATATAAAGAAATPAVAAADDDDYSDE
jgi:hypothetical protein